jgi:hypothetical protein
MTKKELSPISVAEACRQLDARGVLKRLQENHSARIVEHVRELIGGWIPPDLEAFYQERVGRIGEFSAIAPVWNDRVGWRTEDRLITQLLHVEAVPVMSDGCGDLFGLDLSDRNTRPAVYFFDHEDGFARPRWAAGSSLGRFLLLMANHDRAYDEQWPADWWLSIDPDIVRCRRASALWLAN